VTARVDDDQQLYLRGLQTLFAAWRTYARGSVDAVVQRLPGVTTAVFPSEPERSVYNNAVFDLGLTASARAAAIAAMESAYAARGVARFAAWVHASDPPLRRDFERRGYVLDTSTLAMGLRLAELRVPRPRLDLCELHWSEYLDVFDLPAGLLSGADRSAFDVLVARVDGEPVATVLGFDFAGDCGLYNVGTLERARRRGLGTALTALAAHAARARGCSTASLQSTPMAERVYAAVGFRDLGRILEYVPPAA
jgi:GNAT superfamily N-acetyltransferase